jgi:hypothetical protein
MKKHSKKIWLLMIAVFVACTGWVVFYGEVFPAQYHADSIAKADSDTVTTPPSPPAPAPLVLDKADYDQRMLALANNPPLPPPKPAPIPKTGTTTGTKTPATPPAPPAPIKYLWPAKDAPYPNGGALLPFNRIVAYYGNFYSKGMGVLGQYPPDEMLQKLNAEVLKWTAADPTTPVIPAIDYIAVTAQASAGADGKYRARMPDDQIDKALALASQVHGIVFLEIQDGLSNLQTEIPLLEKYLKMPQVHLCIDPEFSMKDGARPGREIGTMDATDINYAANYLAKLVRDNNLTPKILVVHRFTQDMVTNYKNVTPLPEVQIIMDMDGWGSQAKKIGTYTRVVRPEPIQFTGFKLFYKNDLLPPSTGMLTPQQILDLNPRPIYIQYQ